MPTLEMRVVVLPNTPGSSVDRTLCGLSKRCDIQGGDSSGFWAWLKSFCNASAFGAIPCSSSRLDQVVHTKSISHMDSTFSISVTQFGRYIRISHFQRQPFALKTFDSSGSDTTYASISL
eukprot:s235_g9.t1